MIERVLLVALVLGAAAAVGWWRRRRAGRLRTAAAGASSPSVVDLDRFDLRPRPGTVGALLFGAPMCAPCDRAMAVLAEVSTRFAAFDWTYADAAEHLETTRRLRILRVPTVVVVDDRGTVLARASGVPRAEELVRVLTPDAT